MRVEVELTRKENPFDSRSWSLSVPCGEGNQTLRWLAYATCLRMSIDTGYIPTSFIPQLVRSTEGKVLNIDTVIKEALPHGGRIEIECSKGPKAFSIWQESEPNIVPNVPEPIPSFTEIDKGNQEPSGEVGTRALTLEITDCLRHWIHEVDAVVESLKPYLGAIQTLFIWYSCKGNELEDKDFGVLNVFQFKQMFRDAKLSLDYFNEELLDDAFSKTLHIEEGLGAYQLSVLEFLPTLFLIVRDSRAKTFHGNADISTKVVELVKHYLIPTLRAELEPELVDLKNAAQMNSSVVFEEVRESLEACLKSCRPKYGTDLQVNLWTLLPYLKVEWFCHGNV